MRGTPRRWLSVFLAVSAVFAFAACGDDDDGSAAADTQAEGGGSADTLRLGYFPNVTHGPAIVGVDEGIFEEALGDTELETSSFNAGPEASEALFAGAIDATFIGPNPAINAFAQSDGEAIRIISGSTSGGAYLVTKPEITEVTQLEGKKLASPQLGNTQDVALRAYLAEQGFETDTSGGGEVSIIPQENADTLTAFQAGDIDGAWVPEPWATRLIEEGGGHVLVDERDLWPEGEYVTTHLIVRTEYLDENPETVEALLEGVVESVQFIQEDSDEAKEIVNDGIEALTEKRLSDPTIDGAWQNLTFTWDPIAPSLQKSKDDAVEVGLLEEVDLEGIYDLDLLNEVLAGAGEEEVEGL